MGILNRAKPGSLAVDTPPVTRPFNQTPPARRVMSCPLSKREVSVLAGMADGM